MDDFGIVIAVGFVISIIFGLITASMNYNKGYQGGFFWGFFLGILGIIIVAVRPFNVQNNGMGPMNPQNGYYPPNNGMMYNNYPQNNGMGYMNGPNTQQPMNNVNNMPNNGSKNDQTF